MQTRIWPGRFENPAPMALVRVVLVLPCVVALAVGCVSRVGDGESDDGWEPYSAEAPQSLYEEIATLDIGRAASGLAFDEATQTLYATRFDNNASVTAISPTTGEIVQSVEVAPGGHKGLAMAHNGRFVFVTNYDIVNAPGDTVVRLDAQTGFAQTGLIVGYWACGVWASPDDERVFVLTGCDGRNPHEDTGGALHVIDAEAFDDEHVVTIPIPEDDYFEVRGFIPDPNNDDVVYVSTRNVGGEQYRLLRIELSTQLIEMSEPVELPAQLDPMPAAEIRIAYDPMHEIVWMFHGSYPTMVGIDPGTLEVVATADVPCYGAGFEFRNDGMLAMSCFDTHEIVLFENTETMKPREEIGNVHAASWLMFDSTGDWLFVNDYFIGLARIYARAD